MNMHFYVDLIALSAAILTLVPIYRDYGRKFFAIALLVLFLCVAGLSIWMSQSHNHEILTVQNHIRRSLRNEPRTFDELAQSLGYKEVGKMSEALDAMLDRPEPEIQHDDVRLQNCDGSVAGVVRRYYLRNIGSNTER